MFYLFLSSIRAFVRSRARALAPSNEGAIRSTPEHLPQGQSCQVRPAPPAPPPALTLI